MGWRRGSTVEGGGALHWLPPGPGPSPVPDVGRAGFATRAERVHPEDARGPPPLPVPCSSLCCPWGTLGTAVNPGVSLRLSRHSWRKGGVGGIFISSSLHLTCEGSQVCGPASPSLAVRLEGSQRHQSVCPPTGSPSRHVCLVWDLACKILHNKQTDCCCVISVKSAVTVRRASQIDHSKLAREAEAVSCLLEPLSKQSSYPPLSGLMCGKHSTRRPAPSSRVLGRGQHTRPLEGHTSGNCGKNQILPHPNDCHTSEVGQPPGSLTSHLKLKPHFQKSRSSFPARGTND